MEPNVSIYFDESGTTGGHLLDPDQPIFVYGGVLLQKSMEDSVLRGVEELVARSRFSKSPELKYSRLRSSTAGLKLIADVLDLLDGAGGLLIASVVEKRFHLVTIFVETFLDSESNPYAPPQNARTVRRGIADAIYENITLDLLTDFNRALRDDDRGLAVKVCQSVCDRLVLLRDPNAARLAGALRHGASGDFFWFVDEIEGAPELSNVPSPLIHALMPLAYSASQFLTSRSECAELVVDDDDLFGPVLQWVLSTMSSPDEVLVDALTEFDVTPQMMNRIAAHRRLNSTSSRLVQCADLIAGHLREVATVRGSGAILHSRFSDVWKGVRPLLLRGLALPTLSADLLEKGIFDAV